MVNAFAASSRVGIELEEGRLPIPGPVTAACEILGFDPLYVANEGVLVALVDGQAAMQAVEAMRAVPVGEHATVIGRAVAGHPGLVTLETGIGGTRVVDMLPGEQLPRIC